MSHPRTLPLFDSGVHPGSWNERMSPGDYAVHYSSFESSARGSGPTCTIFGSLVEAEQYATEQVTLRPGLRCRIYDHHGFVGSPIREIQGREYVGESDLSPRFRRWTGSILFFGGLALTFVDWSTDFRLSWPAMLGTRMLIPGLILLVTEAVIIIISRRESPHHQVKRVI
ncbi:hypothetical protein [Edaphobacter aggregans]|uniref:hypothetical protein n=1 Tax=Edaphobacter aggregans TaxID=570835 RepID=UPI00054E3963|nr:hypothetical protein [Edaphobacter aggregans]